MILCRMVALCTVAGLGVVFFAKLAYDNCKRGSKVFMAASLFMCVVCVVGAVFGCIELANDDGLTAIWIDGHWRVEEGSGSDGAGGPMRSWVEGYHAMIDD